MLEKLTRPIHAPDRRKVLDAIGSNGFRVVPQEIAASTGLPLSTVNLELVTIASQFDGHMRVGEKGTITYIFSPQFEAKYYVAGANSILRNSLRIAGNVTINAAKATVLIATILFRMSVGVLLILSVLAVFALILIVIVRAIGGDGDGFCVGDVGDLGGAAADAGAAAGGIGDAASTGVSGSGDLGYWLFRWMWDWWWWHDYFYPTTYQDPVRIGDQTGSTRAEAKRNGRKNDFVSNCFSLVFGEGNPNTGFDEEYWIALGSVIQEYQGVVTAEQLAPVTGLDQEDEDWMLPILVRFNGTPTVTDDGGIIYVFPGYASTANKSDTPLTIASSDDPATASADPLRAIYAQHLRNQKAAVPSFKAKSASSLARRSLLLEREHIFCAAEKKDLAGVIGFAVFELAGSLWLLSAIHSFPFLAPFKALILFLVGYGIFFFATPVIRWFVVQTLNSRIQRRNDRKINLALKVKSPDSKLSAKLQEARCLRLEVLRASTEDNVVYTSERDLLEQSFK